MAFKKLSPAIGISSKRAFERGWRRLARFVSFVVEAGNDYFLPRRRCARKNSLRMWAQGSDNTPATT
jgi:hypothetical protein